MKINKTHSIKTNRTNQSLLTLSSPLSVQRHPSSLPAANTLMPLNRTRNWVHFKCLQPSSFCCFVFCLFVSGEILLSERVPCKLLAFQQRFSIFLLPSTRGNLRSEDTAVSHSLGISQEGNCLPLIRLQRRQLSQQGSANEVTSPDSGPRRESKGLTSDPSTSVPRPCACFAGSTL